MARARGKFAGGRTVGDSQWIDGKLASRRVAAIFPWYDSHLAWLRRRGAPNVPKQFDKNARPIRGKVSAYEAATAALLYCDVRGLEIIGAVVPVVRNIDARILKVVEDNPDRFDMFSWGCRDHSCGTSMCRGGWAIHLAGPSGYELMETLRDEPGPAAALIYAASRPGVPIPNFFVNNKTAIADMKRCVARGRA